MFSFSVMCSTDDLAKVVLKKSKNNGRAMNGYIADPGNPVTDLAIVSVFSGGDDIEVELRCKDVPIPALQQLQRDLKGATIYWKGEREWHRDIWVMTKGEVRKGYRFRGDEVRLNTDIGLGISLDKEFGDPGIPRLTEEEKKLHDRLVASLNKRAEQARKKFQKGSIVLV